MADTRTYIRLHDGMPDHPKVDGLSDKAFRLLVEAWCWCSRHLTDGHMPAATWRKRSTTRARRELVAAGLAVLLDDDSVRFHDYLEHQRSADEVAAAKAAKGSGGSLGNHRRWHEDRGIVKPGCPFCPQPPDDDPEGDPSTDQDPTGTRSDNRSHDRSEDRSHNRYPDESQNGNDAPHKRSLIAKRDASLKPRETHVENPATSGNVSDPPSDNRSQTDRKTSPETTTDTETDRTPYGGSSRGSVSRHPADRYARERADDDLTQAIAGLVEQHTGRPCPPDHAAAVRSQLLDGRDVERPLPYVVKAIRENPGRYLPPAPPTPPRAEPWMAVPNLGERDNGETNARGRAQVEAAIAAARNRTAPPEEADEP
ncbi:hypothetical protein [Actinomadura decatromicini]|uniref:Uncharacterized protein n=1 Tax=Actinomadura decatromicini TaxID=2604572 RepID=A0A5D3FIQ2_9ACTN|nr:hypothetical protein [Actinomadura decatromicini]TYK47175.1 hypothetical protein FXF68_25590 [Actinomadura decatromicini]